MSAKGLQTLLASTITDNAHRSALLNRNPSAYVGFDLSADEVTLLLGIHASSLEEFALQAHRLFYHEEILLEGRAPIYVQPPMFSAMDVA